ncbi:HEWD family protein [Halorussus lipolyticus]|uniref:HEWD family protein n=1 Tax=Halorussus lipolyticus TaxID=3034024 RepID=UPI0023E89B62|nr:HEWD family protein [Halorussus sp. DT80]
MTELDPPDERECRECGRRDAWNPDSRSWRIRDDAHAGNPHCIHDWDINGTYLPIRE